MRAILIFDICFYVFDLSAQRGIWKRFLNATEMALHAVGWFAATQTDVNDSRLNGSIVPGR